MKKEDIVQAIVDFGQPAVERMGTRHMLRALHEVEAELPWTLSSATLY